MATGVLPLALGRATRLVRYLIGSDKEYDATIAFGFTTDSFDVTGTETSRTNLEPSRPAVSAALGMLTGTYLQTPPPFSAKKIRGQRAYALARSRRAVELTPVPVTVSRAELIETGEGWARVALTCSAGFYVRTFAHRLGEIVGCGACLDALRRTRSGPFRQEAAIPMGALQDPGRVEASLVPMERLLPDCRAVRVNERGREDVRHGREITEDRYDPVNPGPAPPGRPEEPVRILDADGALVALAAPGRARGSLHPSVVLI